MACTVPAALHVIEGCQWPSASESSNLNFRVHSDTGGLPPACHIYELNLETTHVGKSLQEKLPLPLAESQTFQIEYSHVHSIFAMLNKWLTSDGDSELFRVLVPVDVAKMSECQP